MSLFLRRKRKTYTEKMSALLLSSSAVEVKISKFNSHVREVRKKVHKAVNILPEKKDRLATLEPNPRVPKLFGLPKLHKSGTPMRPVISTISSPTYKLAALVRTLRIHWIPYCPFNVTDIAAYRLHISAL